MVKDQLISIRRRKRSYALLTALGIVLLTVWSGMETGFSLTETFFGIGESVRFILFDFLPPDFSAIPSLMQPALDTLFMSIVGMVIGSFIAGILAFLAATTTAPHPVVQVMVRAFASLLRNIPVLIWTILLAAAYGLGNLVGLLSLILVTVGGLVRAYAELLEEIDMNQVEAVRATGAGYFQVITQAVLPQFLPGFVGWSLYNLEMNVRASSIIGMVGGGGLGFSIQAGIKLFQYSQVSMAILLVILLIFVTEFVTSKLRERLL